MTCAELHMLTAQFFLLLLSFFFSCSNFITITAIPSTRLNSSDATDE